MADDDVSLFGKLRRRSTRQRVMRVMSQLADGGGTQNWRKSVEIVGGCGGPKPPTVSNLRAALNGNRG
jgi:hypothetical protein